MRKSEYFNQFFLMVGLFFLGGIILGNFIDGFNGFWTKLVGGLPDDFIMRYRESLYVSNRINPFDVIFGLRPVETNIGELWDVAGYTPWGMALGIIFNFTFIPEGYAHILFLLIYLMIICIAGVVMYLECRKRYDYLLSIFMTMFALAIPGWGTGLDWLNFGAIFGAFIFFAVLLLDDHPIFAGILFGITATKPQLAAPFYLGLLLKRQYKTLGVAIIIPVFLWVIALLLTSTSIFEMIIQFSNIMNIIGGQLGNWISSWTVLYDFNSASKAIQILGALLCIVYALFLWKFMKNKSINDNITFYSVAAILSGMWTYSQAHDRTVLLIVLLCLFTKFKEVMNGDKIEKILFCLFTLSCIINTSRLGSIFAAGNMPGLFFDLIKYMVWIALLLYIAIFSIPNETSVRYNE